jgi:adenosylcobyric acid synthase
VLPPAVQHAKAAGQRPNPGRGDGLGADTRGFAVKGALLIAGTTSAAGKSVLAAGICRWLRRQGVRVAPFKAQSMSLSSFVTLDGAEIGRAQAMQAAAAGLEPDARMNPVLLKAGPGASQVIVLGQLVGEVDAAGYAENADRLLDVALDCLGQLRREFDVVICEGAGSPAEISRRDTDIANMRLARSADLPTILVADIDRGGAVAGLYGTLALLEPADQALVAAFVVNKFRGDRALLTPGLGTLRRLTGRPVLGVLPWTGDLWLDAEDSVALDTRARPAGGPPLGHEVLRVSVIRLPRISNFTDIDALSAEPGVLVRMAATAEELADADLVIVPGSRATVADLAFLRERGMSDVLSARALAGRPILGICGGFQMLTEEIADDVESGVGTVSGLGLLPAAVRFAKTRTLGRPTGIAYGVRVSGYEIRRGVVRISGITAEPFLDGCRSGAVWGTSWHGTLENDQFRRAFLADVAAFAGRDFKPAPDTNFAALRQASLDTLGDLVADNLDTDAMLRLIEGGPPGLPVLTPARPKWRPHP